MTNAILAKIWSVQILRDLQESHELTRGLDFGPIPSRTWPQWWEQKTHRFRLAYRVLRTGDCDCDCW